MQLKDPGQDIKRSGVYKLWFGDKFYIGRSRHLNDRLRSHERDLNRRKNGRWWNITGPQDFYQFVIMHLKKNPQINVAYMEVLEYCKTDEELIAAEQKYFDMHEWDVNCLNLGLVASPYTDYQNGIRQKVEPKKAKKKKNVGKKVRDNKPKRPIKKDGKPLRPLKMPPGVQNAKLMLLIQTMENIEKEYSNQK